MLKDITIGQYFPGDSIIHRLDPRFKIIITFIYILMLFTGSNILCLTVGAVYTVMAILLSRIPFKMFVKSVRPLLPFLIITALLNLFLVDSGDTYFHWKFLKITEEGVNISVFMIIRIVLLIMGSSLLTYTTSPITLTDAIERLLSPLKKLKFPVHELAMMMSIALRFIPTLIEETDKIMSAQKARGAEIDSGSFMTRARNMISILVPLFISSFRRADELATAMECRCYNGGEGRTRLRQLKSSARDYIALAVTIIFYIAAIVVAHILK
ncbi:energy-coupling factor transporter transmembrane protein EcfT [Ruminococcus sp. XPD3002]|uniref:energy-coupling factor transporter transmembrane component T family protein n=1 Tax=Ruminococcus sp. XPD3002 TaxID=1452269 RepID=UPI0009112BBA|nr:energy-coupling factor transporter transmembrane protein EcfT [Ruminococcus sp.]SFX17089.1 energy-coupling factor transport system permease protein [Ruminococcus flavefaciens]HPY83707.1 energy-coupling factor transporter transmembrane component T [Ruminococcus flavefaciens]